MSPVLAAYNLYKTMSKTLLELKNLTKAFGKNKVLNGINLTVKEGSVLGLMG